MMKGKEKFLKTKTKAELRDICHELGIDNCDKRSIYWLITTLEKKSYNDLIKAIKKATI